MPPVRYIYKIMGILYIDKKGGTNLFKNIAWTLPLLFIYIMSFLRFITTYSLIKYENFNVVMRTGDTIAELFCSINMITRIITGIKNRNQISDLFRNLSKYVDYSTSQNYFVLFILTLSLSWIAHMLIYITDSESGGLPIVFSYSSNLFIGYLESYLHYEILNTIRRNLRTVNSKLMHCQIVNVKSKDVTETVLIYGQVHYKLISLATDWNNIFNIIILLTCGSNFAMFFSCAHYAISTTSKILIPNSDDISGGYIVLCVMWILHVLAYFYFNITFWTAVTKEVSTIIKSFLPKKDCRPRCNWKLLWSSMSTTK